MSFHKAALTESWNLVYPMGIGCSRNGVDRRELLVLTLCTLMQVNLDLLATVGIRVASGRADLVEIWSNTVDICRIGRHFVITVWLTSGEIGNWIKVK